MILIRAMYVLFFAIAVGYAALRLRRQNNRGGPAESRNRFRPCIGFTPLDGMESLSLLLANESNERVWAEEIEIFLSDLRAEQQTAEASCREIQKIRQTVREGDMLPISLAGVIYKAAGEPQRKYSCGLSSVLRYRIGEETFATSMENYKIQMIGLKAASAHRDPKPAPQLQNQDTTHELPALALKAK